MGIKIYIAVCSGRDWKPQFGASLCHLIGQMHRSKVIYFLNIIQASGIFKARQSAISDAIAGEFSHILFLDDDMVFPPNILDGLIAHDLGIVAINYARREEGNKNAITHAIDGSGVFSKGKSGVEEVGWIGFGGVLIKIDSIKNIENPFFEIRWHPEREDFVTEDTYFCMKVRSAGIKIYVDHDISNKVFHVGDYLYHEEVA